MADTQPKLKLKLFAVRLPDGSLLPSYFGSKAEAKRVRDQYDGAVVVLGPDHKRYGGTTCAHHC